MLFSSGMKTKTVKFTEDQHAVLVAVQACIILRGWDNVGLSCGDDASPTLANIVIALAKKFRKENL